MLWILHSCEGNNIYALRWYECTHVCSQDVYTVHTTDTHMTTCRLPVPSTHKTTCVHNVLLWPTISVELNHHKGQVPECQCSIFTSGRMEEHHQYKLQRVIPPHVHVCLHIQYMCGCHQLQLALVVLFTQPLAQTVHLHTRWYHPLH